MRTNQVRTMLEIFATEGAISTPELQRRLNLSGRTLMRARQEMDVDEREKLVRVAEVMAPNYGDDCPAERQVKIK